MLGVYMFGNSVSISDVQISLAERAFLNVQFSL